MLKMEETRSEEIKEMNPDDKNHKKDSDGYEKSCYLCHRPESKVDKMITIPNQITICSDCMQKNVRPDRNAGNAKFSGNGYDESWQYGFRATE